ncbi:MAG: helix-turn-helix domain-containing protein [Blautia massiliensis (ex Durand et al. 2017)]|uniref:helix-turn-helix domain-containing protein n=1 Tax=Blautia massiliensis (ex Durand et al. 2017) TaxID=1737424 RepID=UPI00399087C9
MTKSHGQQKSSAPWLISKKSVLFLLPEFFDSTPHADLNLLRLEKAKNLLTNEALPVQQVALLCGFSNLSHFSRYFRKNCGCSPSEWARRP